jgi:general secretion pathway protein G
MTNENKDIALDGAIAPAPRPSPRRGRRRRRGLTLIEILVVLVIVGLIGSVVGVTVMNQLDDAKIDTANVQLKSIGEALELYKIKFNQYPNSAEGLQALVKPPGGKKPLMESLPKDPWDGDYIYVYPGQHNTAKYDLSSKGPDGVADSEDDVKNW